MRLRFVIGRAGAGKSTWIYRDIAAQIDRFARPIYLVVPEQYTLHTEKELIGALGKRGLMQVRVVSPSRLAGEVFAQVSQDRRKEIGESGLAMALRASATQICDDLLAYRNVLGYYGFSLEMVRLIAECRRFDIGPDQIAFAAERTRGALQAKTQDIALLYRHYDAFLESHQFIDSESHFNLFINNIAAASFLAGCRFYFDGFDYLSAQSCRMVEQLIAVADEVTLTLDDDPVPSQDDDLFQAARRNAARLTDIAQNLGAELTRVALDGSQRGRAMPPDVAHLERNLFAWPGEPSARQGDVQFCCARTVEEEVEAAACRILALVRRENLRWREIAIQCGDHDNYAPVIARIFGRYRIPVFIDTRKQVLGHPAIQFVLALLQVIERGFRAQDVMRLWKTGFFDFDRHTGEQLELYLTAFGLRGASAWGRPWKRGQDRFDLTTLNRCRETVHSLTQALQKAAGSRKATGRRWAGALYSMLEDMGFDEMLDAQAAQLREEGLIEESAVTGHVWNSIVEVLDQLSELLEEDKLAIDELSGILRSGFETIEIGILPTGVDQVQIGSIDRSKYSGLKYMFLLGASGGNLSQSPEIRGPFTARDIDELAALGLEVSRDCDLRDTQRRFAVYQAVAKGARGLYVSWPQLDIAGAEIEKDRLVERMLHLLPAEEEDITLAADIIADSVDAEGFYHHLSSMLAGYSAGQSLRAPQKANLKWHLVQPGHRERTEQVLRLFLQREEEADRLSEAGILFSASGHISASQLEVYAHCPFKHLVSHGLRPVEWKEYGVPSTDAGNFLHLAMERFGELVENRRIDLAGATPEEVRAMMNTVTQALMEEFEYGLLTGTARLRWTGGNLRQTCEYASDTQRRLAEKGQFQPFGQEVRFGRGAIPAAPLELADGSTVFLQGRVDRLDILKEDDREFFRIVDYKSSSRGLSTRDAVNGLDTQLWLYAHALRVGWPRFRKQPGTVAGAYIFPLINPWLDEDAENHDKQRKEALRLSGWCLNDEQVLAAMDRGLEEDRQSDLFNINLKSARGSGLMAEQDVDAVLDVVLDHAKSSLNEIRHGRVAIHPWRDGRKTACAYCSYRVLCRIDVRQRKNYRSLLSQKQADMVLLERKGEPNDEMDE